MESLIMANPQVMFDSLEKAYALYCLVMWKPARADCTP